MLDQVEQRRLGPVDVLHDECQRPLACTALERLPGRPEDLLRRSCGEHALELVLGPRLAEDLDERPVGDALAIRETTAGKDNRFIGQSGGNLAGQPRLADARRTDHGYPAATPLGNGIVEG